jgi:ABC-type Zn2+ transport system substrate-binding protein/surface adhesin
MAFYFRTVSVTLSIGNIHLEKLITAKDNYRKLHLLNSVYTHTHKLTHKHTHAHTNTHTQTDTHTHKHTHTQTHTHKFLSSRYFRIY